MWYAAEDCSRSVSYLTQSWLWTDTSRKSFVAAAITHAQSRTAPHPTAADTRRCQDDRRRWSDLLQDYRPARTLRSSDKLLLSVPRMALAFSAKAFSVSAPSVWNSLSYQCRSAELFSSFRHILTRGQSNLTKSASRVRSHPRGSKVVPLNSWGMVSY